MSRPDLIAGLIQRNLVKAYRGLADELKWTKMGSNSLDFDHMQTFCHYMCLYVYLMTDLTFWRSTLTITTATNMIIASNLLTHWNLDEVYPTNLYPSPVMTVSHRFGNSCLFKSKKSFTVIFSVCFQSKNNCKARIIRSLNGALHEKIEIEAEPSYPTEVIFIDHIYLKCHGFSWRKHTLLISSLLVVIAFVKLCS